MEKSPHFKPKLCALLLIDHQVGTTQLIKNITADQSIRNAVTLARAALAFDMPIVMTSSQEDHVQGPLHPSLAQAAPAAFAKRVQRQGVVNAWDDPNFAKAVADTGRKQLIIAAVTTDICLVFPTISAVEAGYEVQAVLDASGSSFAIGEETSRRRMERAGVWLTSDQHHGGRTGGQLGDPAGHGASAINLGRPADARGCLRGGVERRHSHYRRPDGTRYKFRCIYRVDVSWLCASCECGRCRGRPLTCDDCKSRGESVNG